MVWRNFKIAGIVYDLGHLNSTVIAVTPAAPEAPTFNVKVLFHCHTFTRELTAADTPDLHFQNGGELRCFCTVRHSHSLLLPGMVQAAANGGQTYFSQGANMLLLDAGTAGGPYCAFYKMRRSNRPDVHAVMEVVSAYPKPNLPHMLSALSFPTVVSTISAGQALNRPKPRRAW